MAFIERVDLSSDVQLVCNAHAYTTENEEVMGLLLGSVSDKVVQVWSVSVLSRVDKRKDRVEFQPEQLATVTAEAEKLSFSLGQNVRVVGWYHSHPHITVHPSHVDLRTQALYQTMDSTFVGLIFACFNKDTRSQIWHNQMIAFQSIKSFGDSSNTQSEFFPIEIAINVIPPPIWAPNALLKLVELQDILVKEEDSTFRNIIADNNISSHPLGLIHSCSVYQKSVCRMAEYCSIPLLQMLQDRLIRSKQLFKELKDKEKL
eukprot:TRINITY_DN1818_c0_g3_i1.p1 TRINITY_DN1818_c0_g3~~TRINITY_DN1818_c0_g3_i1.p1  ORF type:complete len:260 (+),score=106.51 TRINITY_DN1818_c0_g3_i1:90-869(+)